MLHPHSETELLSPTEKEGLTPDEIAEYERLMLKELRHIPVFPDDVGPDEVDQAIFAYSPSGY